MKREPLFRASNAQDSYAFLDRYRPGMRAHLRAKLDPAMLHHLEDGARTGWIPVELDGPYVTGVAAALGGADATRDAYRRFTATELVKSPAVRALFDGVVRIFGVSVGSLLRALPGGFQQAYRDVLTLEVTRGDREAEVVLADIAPEVLRYEAYVPIWNGVLLGLYDVVRTPPQLDFRFSRASRRIDAHYRW